MGSDAAVGQLALIKELDERGTRDVKEVGGLLRGDLGLNGIDRHGVTARKLLKHIEHEARGYRRQRLGQSFPCHKLPTVSRDPLLRGGGLVAVRERRARAAIPLWEAAQ